MQDRYYVIIYIQTKIYRIDIASIFIADKIKWQPLHMIFEIVHSHLMEVRKLQWYRSVLKIIFIQNVWVESITYQSTGCSYSSHIVAFVSFLLLISMS